MIDVLTMELTEHVFTWHNPVNGEEMSFATERLAKWCKENEELEVFLTPVEVIHAGVFLKDRGIEPHRLSRVMKHGLDIPLIYLTMDDDTHLLCDGHHRYVVAAMTSRHVLKAYILTKDQWEPFVIAGIPKQGVDKLRGGYSGIE